MLVAAVTVQQVNTIWCEVTTRVHARTSGWHSRNCQTDAVFRWIIQILANISRWDMALEHVFAIPYGGVTALHTNWNAPLVLYFAHFSTIDDCGFYPLSIQVSNPAVAAKAEAGFINSEGIGRYIGTVRIDSARVEYQRHCQCQ